MRRQRLEQDLAQRSGELISLSIVREQLVKAADVVNAQLSNLPAALAMEVAKESDPAKCERLIAARVDAVVAAFAEMAMQSDSDAAARDEPMVGSGGLVQGH